LAQAGLVGADDASISDGDLIGDDGDSMEISDEEESDKESVEAESDDESVEESGAESDIAGDDRSESSSNDDEDMSYDEEGDDVDEAAAEVAHLKQLQDEEFESELRKLTMEALEKGKVTARTGAGGKVSSQMPAAPQFIAKKPAGDQIHSVESEPLAVSPLFGEEGIAFKLFKRGNKGKQEEVQLIVPKDTNLARRATKHDDAAAKERDLLKARVLHYEASRESADAGGNVYLDESKLQVIRNRPLTIETITKAFGKTTDAPYKVTERFRGRGPGRVPGRGRGAGRLFNPGCGRG
jgi:regulator of nonsense transcripts 2